MTDPIDEAARLAHWRAQLETALPAVAGAVAAYREAVGAHLGDVPELDGRCNGDRIRDFDVALQRWSIEVGAADLRGLLGDIWTLVASADEPATAGSGARP